MFLIWTIFMFIVAITVLVAIHEWGHLLLARANGVKVLKFSIGFGKPLWSHTASSGTVYQIATLPLGGYVKLLDEQEGPVPDDLKPYSLNTKSTLAKLSVVLAGPVFNFLLAILLYAGMFWVGIKSVAPVIGEVASESVAARAQFKAGDEIIRINGQAMFAWQDVAQALLQVDRKNGRLNITVRRGDQEQHLTLSPQPTPRIESLSDLLSVYGLTTYKPILAPVIGSIMPGLPAEKAGLLAGDKIISVNGEPLPDWRRFVEIIKASPDIPMQLDYVRDGERGQVTLRPEARMEKGDRIGFMGIQSQSLTWPPEMLRIRHYGFLTGLAAGAQKTWQTVQNAFTILARLVSGQLSVQNLSGPVGIAQGAGISASISFAHYLNFLGLISVSLGVINLLPIPLLDGGRAFFYLIEAIIRRPVPEKLAYGAAILGILLLVSLMLITFVNDIKRLI